MEPTQDRPAGVRDALEGVRYPARRSDLIDHARAAQAPAAVVAELERLPAGMTFSSPTEVSMRIKEHAAQDG